MDDLVVNGSDDGQLIIYNFLNNRQVKSLILGYFASS